MSQNIQNVIATFVELNGDKDAVLDALADAACTSLLCGGISCTSCPFYSGDTLKASFVEVAGELA